ncbi:tetratricopeptide repeat protein [Sphingobacterium siyangense]|uniref:tetratricopeptide repeat protein n=1 Tax=Sphingobacterium siyangense TaxID=459529 RepID=UPI003DA65EAE
MNHFKFQSAVFIFLCWVFVYPAIAQQQTFPQKEDYLQLLERAAKENKPMFLVVHQRDDQFIPFRGSVSKKAKDILSTQFVSGIVQVDRDEFDHPLQRAFYLNKPMYLVTDKHGIPILRIDKAVDGGDELERLIDSANTLAKAETLGKLIAEYRKGMRQQSLLSKILRYNQTFDQYTDQQLLSDYIAQLTIEQLNNFETVIFLLSCGPVYNSKSYLLARTNNKMVDSLYSSLPLPVRKKINNRIIQRTFRESLDKKNFSLAQEVGYFAYTTWTPNYLRASNAQAFHPLEYKRLMKDSLSYIQMARNYYDQSFYRVDPDSLSRIDFAQDRQIQFTRNRLLLDSAQNAEFKSLVGKGRKYYQDDQATNLNYGAQQILAFEKNNPEVIFDAIRWQKKTIELKPDVPAFRYTMALLLYRVGFYAQAEEEQQRAVKLSKSNKLYQEKMKAILKQMQSRLL